jgi:HEAT repeat protein
MFRPVAFRALLLVLACLALPAQDVSSPDPKQRRKAARELARQGSPGIPGLQTLLSDSELTVRIEAVKAIVQIGTQHSLDPLIQATRDPDPEIQIRATDGLVNFYLPDYVRTGFTSSLRRVGTGIKGKFTDTNDQILDPFVEVRAEVIEALGKVARGGSSMESRANAARALGILRGQAAVPDLLEAVRSKDSRVLYECLVAFQKIKDLSVGLKLSFLLRDLDEKVQIAAVETAGLLYNKEALPRLREIFLRTRSKKVRRAVLTTIAMLPDPANRDLLLRHLTDKDEDLREAAAEGLARIGDAADRPLLEKRFAEEKKNSPRVSVAFALVMLGRVELSEFSPLQYLVNTLNSKLRAKEARTFLIEAARNTGIRRTLHTALVRGTRAERIYLAQVMAQSGDRETVPLLQSLTRDTDVQVAQEAVRALRTLQARLP